MTPLTSSHCLVAMQINMVSIIKACIQLSYVNKLTIMGWNWYFNFTSMCAGTRQT